MERFDASVRESRLRRRLNKLRELLAHQVKRIRKLPTTATHVIAVRLPTNIRTELVYSLERSIPTLELDLNHLSPFRSQFVATTWVVAEAETFVISATSPNGLTDGNFSTPLRVYKLHDVTVDPSSGLVFGREKVISQSTYGWRRAEDAAFLSSANARVRSATKASVGGPIAPMGGSVFNYYFFLIHALPRILHIRSIEPAVSVVLTDSTPSFARRALHDLQVDFKIVESKAFRHDEVFICDPTRHPWPHPANIRLLRNVPSERSTESRNHPRKIYISRRGGGRQLRNEEKLESFLESRGYVCLQLEHLPWLEQVALFRGAESVVAAHGAGLANAAFMPAGTQVFELTTGSWWFPSMRNISEIAGVSHRVVQLPYDPEFPHGTAEEAIDALRQLI